MAGGDLRAALDKDGRRELVWERKGQQVALDIARGIHFLHSHDVRGLFCSVAWPWKAVALVAALMSLVETHPTDEPAVHGSPPARCRVQYVDGQPAAFHRAIAAWPALHWVAAAGRPAPGSLRFQTLLQVIHCDIKSSNVLLSDDWGTAKVADVGVAQLLGNYNPDNVGWTCVLATPHPHEAPMLRHDLPKTLPKPATDT
jgi:serine/threonine protein kinase